MLAEIFDRLFFTILVIATVVPAVLVVLTLNVVRAACWLLVSLSGAAGLFFYLGADFVGGTQILIYVGGTLVLVIFGVMLTATGPFVNLSSRSGDWAISIVAGIALFVMIAYGLLTGPSEGASPFLLAAEPVPARFTANRLGMAFLGFGESTVPAGGGPGSQPSGYLLPFEIVSVHLIVVLIGAAYLARAKQRRPKPTALEP